MARAAPAGDDEAFPLLRHAKTLRGSLAVCRVTRLDDRHAVCDQRFESDRNPFEVVKRLVWRQRSASADRFFQSLGNWVRLAGLAVSARGADRSHGKHHQPNPFPGGFDACFDRSSVANHAGQLDAAKTVSIGGSSFCGRCGKPLSGVRLCRTEWHTTRRTNCSKDVSVHVSADAEGTQTQQPMAKRMTKRGEAKLPRPRACGGIAKLFLASFRSSTAVFRTDLPFTLWSDWRVAIFR